MPQAKYILRLFRAHHTIVRLAGAVGMRWLRIRKRHATTSNDLSPGRKPQDTELDERIDRVYQSANGGLPDRGELKRLSDEFSVDFAALYLADQITHTPVNRRFRIAFDHAYD